MKRKSDNAAPTYQQRAHKLSDALDEVLADSRKAG
jgi:hypothetical protein